MPTRSRRRPSLCSRRARRSPATPSSPDPKAIYEQAEQDVADAEFKQSYIIGSDPELHLERIREAERLGATIVCLQNGSGADPIGGLRTYGEHALPALTGARV